MSSFSAKDSPSLGCDLPVRIKQEPVDDYYGSCSDEQTPGPSGTSGNLGKRKNQPTWSLRELELSDDERGRDASSSEYEPSCSSEEASESESDGEVNPNQTSSSGIKKRRLSHTYSNKTKGNGMTPNYGKILPTQLISNVNSNGSPSSIQNNSPTFLHVKLNTNGNNGIMAATSSQVSMQSIAQSIATKSVDNKRPKKPAPKLKPLSFVQFDRVPVPELFLMEKIDQIKTLNQLITNDVENYTKCLVIFDQIFTRLRSHPPSETKRLVTIQLSLLLEVIKQRKERGNSRINQEKVTQITSKILSFLRVWPSPKSTPTQSPLNITNNNHTLTNQLTRVEIRKVPQLAPVTPLRRISVATPIRETTQGTSSVISNGTIMKIPLNIQPKTLIPTLQVNQTSTSSTSTQPPLVCIEDDDDDVDSTFCPIRIDSVKTLAKTPQSNSFNTNHGVVQQGNIIIPNNIIITPKPIIADDVNEVPEASAEIADRIPWMGLYSSNLPEEESGEIVQVLNDSAVVATEPLFVRGKFPPNTPIFLENQLSTLENKKLQVPSDNYVAKVAGTNNDTLEFSNRLKAFANQSHHQNIQQSFTPITINANSLRQGRPTVPRRISLNSSSTHPDDVVLLSDDDSNNVNTRVQDSTENLALLSQQHFDIETSNFENDDALNDECVLGI